jgi:hypothetical protein
VYQEICVLFLFNSQNKSSKQILLILFTDEEAGSERFKWVSHARLQRRLETTIVVSKILSRSVIPKLLLFPKSQEKCEH